MKIAWFARRQWIRTWAAGGSLFLLGQCGLSDQQLTSIAQSVISTGLNTIVSQILATLVGAGATAAT
jgi:hypothetical protein